MLAVVRADQSRLGVLIANLNHVQGTTHSHRHDVWIFGMVADGVGRKHGLRRLEIVEDYVRCEYKVKDHQWNGKKDRNGHENTTYHLDDAFALSC